MTAEGFEPSPVKNSALNYRLRPLGHAILNTIIANYQVKYSKSMFK